MMDAFDSWEESNGYIAEDAARLRRAWNAGELHAQDRIDALTEERNSLQSKLTESALQVLAHSTQAHEHWEDAQRYQFLRNQPRRKNYYTEEANWSVAREQHGMWQVFRGEDLDAAIDAARLTTPTLDRRTT